MNNNYNTENIMMKIPNDKAEQVRKYLELLSVKDMEEEETEEEMEEEMEEEKEEETEEIFNNYEVKKIINHSVINNKYYWKIKWKDNSINNVLDSDTNCEKLISKYRENKNIQTRYCFCRVSTKNQVGENHVSLDAQESEITKFSKEKFGSVARHKVYKISSSAYKRIPRQLQIIGDACIKGDSIFIYRVDRLSRNIVKYLAFLEDLNERGVEIYSVSEKISYKDNKTEFIQTILDAQKESELIGKRIKMSIKRRRERGDQFIGRLPYGKKYKRNKKGVLIIVNNLEEQKIISLIKSMRDRKINKICEHLNNNNLLKYNKKRWNKIMIKRILR